MTKWEDPRLTLLTKDLFEGKRVLDIGCNDGTIPLLIALRFDPAMIIGCDIDPTLIKHAIDNLQSLINDQEMMKKFNEQRAKASASKEESKVPKAQKEKE